MKSFRFSGKVTSSLYTCPISALNDVNLLADDFENMNDPDNASCFVVPSSVQLTARQLQVMSNTGQQPGVPFKIRCSGATRPQADKKHVAIADSIVNVKRNSLKLIEKGRRTYCLRFVYDSTVPCKLTVYLGAKDKTTAQRLRIGSALQLWGPFHLPPGLNQEWLSSKEQCLAEESMLPGVFSKPVPDCHDIVLFLDAQESVLLRRKSQSQEAKCGPSLGSAKHKSEPRPSITFAGPKYGSAIRPAVAVEGPQISDCAVRAYNDVLMQATFARIATQPISTTAAAVTGPSPSALSLVVQNQKLLMTSGVFVLLDIYGMDKQTQNADVDTSSNPNIAEAEAGVDTDAEECVICLTEPRCVVVFPCRHMCLCASCAESLPAQGNKCPMCRKETSLLLKLCPRTTAPCTPPVATPPALPSPVPPAPTTPSPTTYSTVPLSLPLALAPGLHTRLSQGYSMDLQTGVD